MATPAKDLVALTLEDGHRPFKRPRTEDSESIDNVAERLGRCLEAQVFPHVERATAQLPADVYDIDKLGAKVITIIVDKGFEQKFHEGRGRLTSTAELTIAAGIHRLVTELAAGPVCVSFPLGLAEHVLTLIALSSFFSYTTTTTTTTHRSHRTSRTDRSAYDTTFY